ncbi:unnamed protein product [Cyclocybe aegerita]|uniref:Uncharacterized protein n=1 Tax=Cyclocybe aegerita TaxID=1973307 RepID=A0A8S0VWK6_CYCAE|nr:unnamed protein product [Cyclocybe aegerita]
MGYGDWTQITIQNKTDIKLQINNSQLRWGKFYNCEGAPNLDTEISIDKDVPAKGSYMVGSCGRENTWSGCDGEFSLYDTTTGKTIFTVYFISPHGSSPKIFRVARQLDGWYFNYNVDLLGAGPLGSVILEVVYVGA